MTVLMNPFDFVPMPESQTAPRLSLSEWAQGGLVTGRIDLKIGVLTPLHITGQVDVGANKAMSKRHMYRRRHPETGQLTPVVEGSSVRGMLRAYVEALTNGVASSYLTGFEFGGGDPRRGAYAKQRGVHKKVTGRHLGFWVGRVPPIGSERRDKYEDTFQVSGETRYTYGDREGIWDKVIPSHVAHPPELGNRARPNGSPGVKVDPATVLFGLVTLDADKKRDNRDDARPIPIHSVKGRIQIDDAWFSNSTLTWLDSLDLADDSWMGGPKPSRSNWWYFERGKIRKRNWRRDDGRDGVSVEFVGTQYRGRKFYFHQDPRKCVKWYLDNWNHQKIQSVTTECVDQDAKSELFSIRFEDLPRCLLDLLLAALSPSERVRHKLGALRPFGFGSVALIVEGVWIELQGLDALRVDALGRDSLMRDAAPEQFAGRGDEARELGLRAPSGAVLVVHECWKRLRFIQHWPSTLGKHRCFVYPPYSQERGADGKKKGFAQPVEPRDVQLAAGVQLPITNDRQKERALDRLFNGTTHVTKKPIDLTYYQTHADNYADVSKDAGVSR